MSRERFNGHPVESPSNICLGVSMIHGLGFFASEDIRAGEAIRNLTGLTVIGQELDRLVDDGGDDLYLVEDLNSVFFNHSCAPNAGVRGKTNLVAIRNVKRGEEITCDYSTIVGARSAWEMSGCNCGSDHCRRVVGNILTIPNAQLQEYYRADALPDFILEELTKLRSVLVQVFSSDSQL